MGIETNLLRNWNEEIGELEERFEKIKSSADKLTSFLIGEIRKKIDEGLLVFLFGKDPEIHGDVTDDFETLYEWKITPKIKKKEFILYIKPHGRSNIPRYIYLQGTNQKTGKSKMTGTRNISPDGIKRLAEKLEKM